ncbi:MAG: PIG-L family deacetylase [Deltaproteobacteria bacterium]|nr:PIG-L family deacetylase [Deltaproteobacteria bacterium]
MNARVLFVGAHPDDEDIGMMFYFFRKHYAKPIYWSATRGEGGQNRVNHYQGNALGVFRTWESLRVRALDGGESLFGPFRDFGFCKNAADAFSKWGRDHLVRALVQAIRTTCPQVVISRWTGGADDLHGHHQAVGQAVRDAFDAAGDPERYPDTADMGLAPWKPYKLYQSTNNAMNPMGMPNGARNPALAGADTLSINTGEMDPSSGYTYQEQAWSAFNLHQTQGIGVLPKPGDFFYYYRLLKSHIRLPQKETDFFAGFDPTLTGLAEADPESGKGLRSSLENVKGLIDGAIASLNREDPRTISGTIFEGLKILRSLRNRRLSLTQDCLISQKIMEFEAVAAFCLGLRLECISSRSSVTPGESIWVRTQLWNFGNAPATDLHFEVTGPESWRIESKQQLRRESAAHPLKLHEVFVGTDSRLSCPYWLEEAETRYRHSVPKTPWNQAAFMPNPLAGQCRLKIDGNPLRLQSPVVFREAFPGGYREKDVQVFPPISIHPDTGQWFLLTGQRGKKMPLSVIVRSHDTERPVEGLLTLQNPYGWEIAPRRIKVRLRKFDDAQTCRFDVTIPRNTTEGLYTLQYRIGVRKRRYGMIMTPVRSGTPGLTEVDRSTCSEEIFMLEPACVNFHTINAKMPEQGRFAYLTGMEEGVLPTLESLGMPFHRLSDRDITHGKLTDFNTIIIGPLAYATRPALKDNAHRLLEYVAEGGRLIVQYQDNSYDAKGMAPYPIKFHRPNDRVTDEAALVTILKPEHPLFQTPNRIKAADFDGWYQDRGLFFLRSWDRRYKTVMACADPNESPLEGGLIHCHFGRGAYVYVAYSLFRQIPLGVAGAFRLFFNLMDVKLPGEES